MITIFKKDTKGKIRYLKTWTEGSKLIQVTGVVGTPNPVPHEKICKAKNVGRSNETHPDDQAIFEMNSLVAEKKKEGYFDTAAEAEGGNVILPMLAKSYKDEAKKVDWKNAYVQPKLDGMRALYKEGQFVSREGSLIQTVPHLYEFIGDIPHHLDGELYGHGLSFQENMRLIKKHRPGESEAICYHVYDIVSDRPFSERMALLRKIVREVDSPYLVFVPTAQAYNEKDMQVFHAANVQQGYEGSILRWGDAPYKINGRSSNLLKYKDFLDIALVIKDIEPADQRPEWGVPVFEWKGATNDELRAGMKYSHAEREEFLKNKKKYIGKVAELRFFEYSETGVPRFPVMVGVRLDKTKSDK